MLSIDQFSAECRAFFDDHYPSRSPQRRDFRWGVGDDSVALFDEDGSEADDREEMDGLRAWRQLLASADLAWITGPPGYGGRGLSTAHQRSFDALASDREAPSSRKLVVSLGMVAPTILAHGSPSARRRYLAALHDGKLVGCQLFSEPGAGSDLASVTTKAVRVDDGWRLAGQKVWTSGAHFSDIGLALCRTSDGPRHHNLTMFVVDMHAPGVVVRPMRQMTGGAAFSEVFLDDVRVPDDDVVGGVGDGWRVALATLSNERSAVGGAGFGGSGLLSVERYVEMVRALEADRDPMVRQRLADLIIHLQVAKMNARRTADARRVGQTPGPEGSIGKVLLASNYRRVLELVSQVLGPRLLADTGEWGTYSWTEFVLGVPGMGIGGGTDEVQRNIIAERVLGLPRS